ncbi:MAG TPA: hypothetical protein VMS41_12080, partial [Gaiellaceae bacterium]|nr:hypothetical protein [Gaiellaceae bacterium]
QSREDDDRMIHAAHASRYHWGEAPECKPENLARGEWQISRVYTVAELPESALRHALRCLDQCEANALTDWDLAYAYEAIARAYKVAGKDPESQAYKKLAAEVPIAEADDREHLEEDLATL